MDINTVQALLTGVLVIITAYYAYQTYKIVKLNEKVIEEQYGPQISIVPYIWDCVFSLLIKNSGKSAARNVRFILDKDVPQFNGKEKLNDFNIFKFPLAAFPAGAEYNIDIAQGFVILDSKNNFPTQFNIHCSYEYIGKLHQEDYCFDLKSYDNTSFPKNPLVDEIKKLREVISKKNVV